MIPDFSKLVHKTTTLPRLVADESAQRLLKIASASDLRRLSRSSKLELCPVPEAKFDIRPGHSYILLITLGDGAHFGANENGDYYPEKSGVNIDFPEPAPGYPSHRVLGKGLKETHSTFRKYGAVYRNHKTEPVDNVPRSGEIVFERYRDDMHRGELIVELPHSKWSKELEDMEKGEPLMWSQGSGVPSDLCNICSYEFSRKSKSRCKHILLYKLCVRKDGIQNCVLCTDASFYDISYVGNNPAAKIAFGLVKVAEAGLDKEDVESWTPIVPIFNHKSEFVKIHGSRIKPVAPILSELRAEEEAVIPGEVAVFRNICSVSPQRDLAFVDLCKSCTCSDLLNTLARLKIILTPTQWWRIFNTDSGESMDVSGFCNALRSVYRRVTGETDDDFAEDADWLPCRCPDIGLLNRFQNYADLAPKPVLTLVIKTAMSAPGPEPDVSTASRYLAREYARYQTACLTTFADSGLARWCVLANAAAM